MTTKIQFC